MRSRQAGKSSSVITVVVRDSHYLRTGVRSPAGGQPAMPNGERCFIAIA